MTITHGSLFAGLDSFGYGFAKAGIETLWRVEIDRDCQRVLRRHHPGDLLLSDVRECGANNLPRVDIISFGSPCQGLSQAGQGRGLMDERSKLFFEAIRILAELKPAFAVWENVPRALTIHRGRDFAAILRAFRECGARDIAWRTLDSRYCGVAQRRERVFLVADFTDQERAAEILFEPLRSAWHPAASRKAGPRVAATITSGVGVTGNAPPGRRREDDVNLVVNAFGASRGGPDDNDAQGGHLVCAPLRGNHYGDHVAAESQLIVANTVGANAGRCHIEENYIPVVAHTITSEGFDGSEDGTGRGIPLIPLAFSPKSGGDVRLGITKNLTGTVGTSQEIAVSYTFGVRRLTPTEVEALFAFPRGYTALDDTGKPISDSARYRMLGNSIVTTIPKWLGGRMAIHLALETLEANTPSVGGR